MAEHVKSTDAAALLHCLDEPGLEGGRVRTLGTADVVCELRLTRTPLSIDNRLYVTKFRGGTALTEPIKVKLTDTSRDI